jgi:hypothetical protein
MSILSIAKAGAAAAVLVAATAGSAFAAGYAYIDHNSSVRSNHSNGAPVINWVSEGDHVWILDQHNGWYKIKIPGQDGWVKASVLDFGGPNWNGGWNGGYGGWGGYGPGFGGCVNGKNVSFCVGY